MNSAENKARIDGFSFKNNIINKATEEQLSRLGKGWIFAAGGTPSHLLECLTVNGHPVTGGRWRDGWKNKTKGKCFGFEYIFLDFDKGMTIEDAIANEFIQQHCLFLYTTASHTEKNHRFRLVFRLPEPIEDINAYSSILKGLQIVLPGSDPAINSASLLYGNTKAKVIEFNLGAKLDVLKCIAESQAASKPRLVKQADTIFTGQATDTITNLCKWLEAIPSDDYIKWVKVGAWLKSISNSDVLDEATTFELFEAWSIQNYVGEKERRCDPQYIENTWLSLEGGGYGLLKIKQLAQLTEMGLVQQIEQLINPTYTY